MTPEARGPDRAPHRSDTLAVELVTPAQVASGTELRFAIHLRNIADRPVHLHLLGREIAFDLVVRDSDGELVWERLEGETVMAILRLESLEAGATLTLEDAWDLRAADGSRVPPGDYRLQGLVPTDRPEPLATPVATLRIAPPP